MNQEEKESEGVRPMPGWELAMSNFKREWRTDAQEAPPGEAWWITWAVSLIQNVPEASN